MLSLGDRDGARLFVAGGEEELLAVRNGRCLAEARLSTTDPYLFAGAKAEAVARLRPCAQQTRYRYDAYAYARLAAGTINE